MPIKTYTKDKEDFLKNYKSLFAELVFWKDSEIEGKVDIKIAIPCFCKQVKEDLNKIKD